MSLVDYMCYSPPFIFPDIGDFLQEEIKGPATFSCNTRTGCKFEEPAMNELISSIFGDSYITLQCKGGECLHYSQVPGYVVRHPFYLHLLQANPNPFPTTLASTQSRQHWLGSPQRSKRRSNRRHRIRT